MDYDDLTQTFIDSFINVIITVLQEYFGAVFELIDTILLLTS
tara:strand:+ start:712 stop:837 length:126 start_codon:yes stop_codon:yes gene_type:complete